MAAAVLGPLSAKKFRNALPALGRTDPCRDQPDFHGKDCRTRSACTLQLPVLCKRGCRYSRHPPLPRHSMACGGSATVQGRDSFRARSAALTATRKPSNFLHVMFTNLSGNEGQKGGLHVVVPP